MTVRKFIDDPSSPSRQRARSLAREGERLHASLLRARQLQGMSQAEVAERLGVSQPTIATFERYDNDPKLSTLYRYAHAVGATIKHAVYIDGVEIDLGWSDMGCYEGGGASPEHAVESR